MSDRPKAPSPIPADRRPRLYVLCGLPGSGKSTYVREHLADAVRISLDDLRRMMAGAAYDPTIEPMIAVASRALLEALLARAVVWRRDFVFDATNIVRSWRVEAIERARRHGLDPICIFIDTPFETACQRNRARPDAVPEAVMARFRDRFEPPGDDEGFVSIRHVRG